MVLVPIDAGGDPLRRPAANSEGTRLDPKIWISSVEPGSDPPLGSNPSPLCAARGDKVFFGLLLASDFP